MKLYGSGFRNCYNGITWGYSRPIGKDTEMVFLEYRRIPKEHNNKLIVDVLNKKFADELRDVGDKNLNEASGFGKKMNRRMKKWTKQLADHFEKIS